MRNGHCMKSFRIRSFSGTYFPLFGQNTDQKNSEYGDLYAVGIFIKINPLGMSYHRIIQAMLFFQHIVRFLWQSNKYVPKLTFWGGVFYSSSLTAKKNLNSFHFRRDLTGEFVRFLLSSNAQKRTKHYILCYFFPYSKLVSENTSSNTLHCNKASFSYNQCVKYERIRVFSNPYFPVLKHNLQFWPYTGKFATEKTPFLSYFTLWIQIMYELYQKLYRQYLHEFL